MVSELKTTCINSTLSLADPVAGLPRSTTLIIQTEVKRAEK
jgi:hypothetical protein